LKDQGDGRIDLWKWILGMKMYRTSSGMSEIVAFGIVSVEPLVSTTIHLALVLQQQKKGHQFI
jgi:hypothetical protein